MMKSLFYTLSFIPKPLFSYFVDIYLFFKIFKLFTSYKITKANLEIAFPEAKRSTKREAKGKKLRSLKEY